MTTGTMFFIQIQSVVRIGMAMEQEK